MDQNILQSMTIEDLAVMVKAGFDDVTQRMATKEDLNAFATKEDLTREVGRLRSDIIDYIAKQNMELKGDLVLLLRGEDRKLFTLIEVMVEKNLLSRIDANRITKLEPFPQAL